MGAGVGLDAEARVEIGEIDPGSPAQLAKLREGDVVLKLDGKDIATREQLGAEVRKHKPGDTVTLTVEREGRPAEVKVKLGEFPEGEARREMELRFPGIFPPMEPEGPHMRGGPPAQTPPGKQPLPGEGRQASPFIETRRFIGVTCSPLNPELAAFFGIKEGTGLLIAKVTDKSPAQKAGLQVGDVIIKVEGQPVTSVNALIDLIQDKKAGDKVKVEFLRDKKLLRREVVLEEEDTESGAPESGDLRSMLESWQGYTDAFQNEILRWQNEFGPELRSNLKRINEDFAQRTKQSVGEVKSQVKLLLKRV